jgi:hypothetical protein
MVTVFGDQSSSLAKCDPNDAIVHPEHELHMKSVPPHSIVQSLDIICCYIHSLHNHHLLSNHCTYSIVGANAQSTRLETLTSGCSLTPSAAIKGRHEHCFLHVDNSMPPPRGEVENFSGLNLAFQEQLRVQSCQAGAAIA